MWWVSSVAWRFSAWKSPVRRSLLLFFGADYNAVTPRDGLAHWDWFKDTKRNILVLASLYVFLPVEWYWDWSVVGHWLCVGVNHKPYGHALHQW